MGSSPGLRPTSERVRAAIFSILGKHVVEGASVLDLYAGAGLLGLESLSRGAARADFVESNRRLCRLLSVHLSLLGVEDQARIYKGRVENIMTKLQGPYGLVFLDPPYRMKNMEVVLRQTATLLTADGRAVVETRHATPLEETYGSLGLHTRRRYGDTAITVYGTSPW